MQQDEARLATLARKTAERQSKAPRCACPCGCQYSLLSRLSLAHGSCVGCRARIHFGGTELLGPDRH